MIRASRTRQTGRHDVITLAKGAETQKANCIVIELNGRRAWRCAVSKQRSSARSGSGSGGRLAAAQSLESECARNQHPRLRASLWRLRRRTRVHHWSSRNFVLDLRAGVGDLETGYRRRSRASELEAECARGGRCQLAWPALLEVAHCLEIGPLRRRSPARGQGLPNQPVDVLVAAGLAVWR
jgi:hypothetical protein